jgi:hypothetical protein
VDKFWRDKMIQTKKQPLILECTCGVDRDGEDSKGLLLRFRKMNSTLEEI